MGLGLMRGRKLAYGLALAGVTILVAACGDAGSGSNSASGPASGGAASAAPAATKSTTICAPPKKVGYVDIYASSPIESQMSELAKQMVATLGWDMHFIDAQANFTTMQQAVQSFVNEKVDLIIVASADAAPIRQGLQDAQAAGIPVIEIGGGVAPDPLYTVAYNEDETRLGKELGDHIVKTVPDAKIADLATSLNFSGKAREEGLQQAIAASGGSAQITATQQIDTSNPTNTSKTLTDMLTANPEINAVFAVFDSMAVPAASAIKAKASEAKLYTNFATPSNLELMKSGQLEAVIDVNLPLTPVVAFDQFINHTKSGAAFDPDAIEKAGGLGYNVVTAANPTPTFNSTDTLAPFLAKWAKDYPC